VDPMDPDPDSDPDTEHCLESRGNSRLAYFSGLSSAGGTAEVDFYLAKNSRLTQLLEG
jgi:hypothetical protein